MNAIIAVPQQQTTSLLTKMASRYDVEPNKMMATLKATAFRGDVSNEQMMSLLIVADQYGLNPWTREIYAFPDKSNGIVPVVGVDGWCRIINEHPQFDGVEFEQDGESCTCSIHRRDRSHPIRVTEYLSECKRNTGPWQSHPRRMLRHKALIQCARLAFGYVGIYDLDEAERIIEADATPVAAPLPVETGSRTDAVKTRLRSMRPETDKQDEELRQVEQSVTYAQVADALHTAGDVDTLDLRADLIRSVANAGHQDELNTLYHNLRDGLLAATPTAN